MAGVADRAAEAAQRKLQQALAALAAANAADPAGLLRPLCQLATLGYGGQPLKVGRWVLAFAVMAAVPPKQLQPEQPPTDSLSTVQDVVAGWARLPPEAQQDVVDTVLLVAGQVAAGSDDWEALEAQLALALAWAAA